MEITPVKAMSKSQFTRRFMSDQSKRKREKKTEGNKSTTDLLGYITGKNEKLRRRYRG